jgi:hypothetical protein
VHALADLLPDGVARRDDLTLATSSSTVSRWLQAGDLVLLHPGVLVLPDRTGGWATRARAATIGARAPLSHLSALTASAVVPPLHGPIHVTVPADRFPRGCPDVKVHRTTLPVGPVDPAVPFRLPVAQSLVDAWGWAHTPRRNPRAYQELAVIRHLVIETIREGQVRAEALRREPDRQPLHGGRAALGHLLDLVHGGCQSELEVFGATHALRIPGLPVPAQQHRVFLPSGRYVALDAAHVQAKVGVELDGWRYHSRREDRERDMRKDTALATQGWSKDPRAPHRSHARSGPLHGGRSRRPPSPGLLNASGPGPRGSWATGVQNSFVRRTSRGGRGRACGARSSGSRAPGRRPW